MKKNYHAIEIKFIAPTNTKGSRIGIKSLRFANSRVIIEQDYRYSNILDLAIDWLEAKGFLISGTAENGSKYLVFTEKFEPLKEV